MTRLELDSLVDEVSDLVENKGSHNATTNATYNHPDSEGNEITH
jgi:hypothetical protein